MPNKWRTRERVYKLHAHESWANVCVCAKQATHLWMVTVFIGYIHGCLRLATGMFDRIRTHNGQFTIFDDSLLAVFIVVGGIAAKQVDE